MAFSRQFRALLRLAGLWAIPWTLIGSALAVVRWLVAGQVVPSGQTLGSWILLHALGYGALGLISGIDVGLLLGWMDRGRSIEEIPPRRLALWSAIGGAGPALLFAGLGLAFGASAAVLVPLLGLGAVSAGISAVASRAVVAGTGRSLPRADASKRLR